MWAARAMGKGERPDSEGAWTCGPQRRLVWRWFLRSCRRRLLKRWVVRQTGRGSAIQTQCSQEGKLVLGRKVKFKATGR